ncbi:hypothetical protein ASPVEDRAFT_567379 [Aspergillus versicolor CBS 583.65]|uniref:Uncharacterized protein n=1 Tax=Aspergillus versicolor CBS 583.65 TaxID=1036611 RepID=A0A1L9PG32_ASPVE|nr:uncharacterized protein ASPVEDRAFT_567379 [Aspergillus versicolor CBS 583.65]OJJ00443.1 hypothetical protein ASPVEDRAFT_567379 [Aspergillus versicolor CBS 583.65]
MPFPFCITPWAQVACGAPMTTPNRPSSLNAAAKLGDQGKIPSPTSLRSEWITTGGERRLKQPRRINFLARLDLILARATRVAGPRSIFGSSKPQVTPVECRREGHVSGL